MAFDIGDTVPLTVNLKNAAGQLVNATTVILIIAKPDGTNDTPTVTNPPASTGVYTFDYVPAGPGRYELDWNFSSPTASYQDVFVVRPGAAIQFISLADAKRQLNIATTDTGSDEEIRDYIEAASGLAELISGRTMRRAVTEKHSGRGCQMVLDQWPVLSVTSVTENGIVLAASGYSLSDSGVLTRVSGYQPLPWARGVDNIAVSYVAGRATVPAAVSLAVQIIVQHLWQTRRGAAQVTGLGGSDSSGVEMEAVRMYGFAVPNRARQLLATVPAAPGAG